MNAVEKELLVAVERGDLDKAKILITSGADVNVCDAYGRTPLMMSSWIGLSDMTTLLIANKANINYQNKNGYTALMKAAMYDHVDVAKILIDYGADLDAKNIHGTDALKLAKRNRASKEVIQLIKQARKKEKTSDFGILLTVLRAYARTK